MTDDDYAIALDMGTATLGWVSTKLNGKVERLKGQTAMGTRLFEEGQTAEERRMARTTRRRLKWRKWRLRLLREIFDEPMAKVDPNFFCPLERF